MINSGNSRISIPAGAENVVVLSENVNRVGLLIFNAGANSAFISFGTDTATGIELPSRQYLPMFPQGATPISEVKAGSVAGTDLHVATSTDGNKANVT